MKRSLIATVALAATLIGTQASAQTRTLMDARNITRSERVHPNMGRVVGDALVVRPIMFVGALAATGVYLVTLPLTFFVDADEEAGELVKTAYWYSSGRDLGRFNARP